MDYSTATTILTCPRKYQHQNIEKLANPEERMATQFGSLWHKIMELHSQGHPEPVEAAAAILGWVDPADDFRTLHKASIAFTHWKKRWGVNGGWKVVETEQPYGVFPEKFRESLDGEPFEGKIDLIVEMDVNQLADVDTGFGVEKWVVDFKTTSRLTFDWATYYRVSNQFKGYNVAGKEKYPDIAGVIVDIFYALKGAKKTGKTEEEREGNQFYRLVLRYDEAALDEAMTDHVVAAKVAEFYRQLDYYPKNTSACHQFNSACPFLDLCDTSDPELKNKIRGTFIEYTFSPWGDGGRPK